MNIQTITTQPIQIQLLFMQVQCAIDNDQLPKDSQATSDVHSTSTGSQIPIQLFSLSSMLLSTTQQVPPVYNRNIRLLPNQAKLPRELLIYFFASVWSCELQPFSRTGCPSVSTTFQRAEIQKNFPSTAKWFFLYDQAQYLFESLI
jgi:hypothetical protein